MSKHKKTFTIFGLAAAAVILVGAMYALSQPLKQNDIVDLPDEPISTVAVGDIEDDVTVKEPDIKPEPIAASEPPVTEAKENDIPLTVIEDKPEPPEKPETAVNTDIPHDMPTDPALTNPAVTPRVAPEPVEPTEPMDNTPKDGDTNSQGQVYVDGFGWVTQGGSNVENKSGSDGDWDKQIGSMD